MSPEDGEALRAAALHEEGDGPPLAVDTFIALTNKGLSPTNNEVD